MTIHYPRPPTDVASTPPGPPPLWIAVLITLCAAALVTEAVWLIVKGTMR